MGELFMNGVLHLPVSVPSQGSLGIEVCRRSEPGNSVDRFDSPIPLMDHVVMPRAE